MDFAISSDILSELLEVAIHSILYTREVYPSQIFRRRKKYNIPIQMCIYPELKDYISNCVGSVKSILEKGKIEKVFVTIMSSEHVVAEKFVFEIKQSSIRPFDVKKDPEFSSLESSLRAFCLKLSISDSLLQPLPPNCYFRVQIQVPEDLHLDVDTIFPWIEPEKNLVEVPDPHIIPLKTLKTEICQMQLYVEESGTKLPTRSS